MDQKNFIVAIVLSVLIIVGWQMAFPPSKQATQNGQQQASTQSGAPAAPAGQNGTAPGAAPGPGNVPGQQPVVSRSEAVALTPRVTFSTPELTGSISLKGARIDDVQLVKYRETIDPKSPPVPVLSPVGSKSPYYAEFGWSSSDAAIKVPGADTVWASDAQNVAPGKPVKLTWDNGQGLVFGLTIAIDEFFMFDVKQSVENKTDKPVTLFPWSLIVRYGEPTYEGMYILHEGPYGVFNGTLKEFSYSDFKGGKQQKIATTGGWVGITDKYWMSVLVPDQKSKVDVSIKQTGAGADVKYQVDYVGSGVAVAPGATTTTEARLFAGAKIVRVISDYESKYGIEKFDLTIDWGWFWFFTKPLFWLLEWLYVHLGNFGLSNPGADRDREGRVLPAGQQVLCGDEQDEAAPARDGEAEGALWRGPPAHEPGADAALSPREGEPGGGLPAHPGADPGVLRALQGALHHHRDAPSAVLTAGSRTCPRPIRSRS